MALEVHDEVTRGAARKSCEAATWADLSIPVFDLPRPLTLKLQRGLLPQPFKGGAYHLGNRGHGRRFGEACQRGDAPGPKAADLISADAGNANEMVLPLPLLFARRGEVAERAVLAGVRGGLWPLDHRHLEAASQTAIVGRHVGKSKRDAFARAQDDVGYLGVGLLDSAERVAVEAELEGVFGPGTPGQLRVQHLVAPRTKRGGSLDSLEKIGDPPPSVRNKDRLVDVGRAGLHGLYGRARRCLEVARLSEADLGYGVAGATQRLEKGPLVLQALPLDQLSEGVLSARAGSVAERDGKLQLRQMLAGCEVAEI